MRWDDFLDFLGFFLVMLGLAFGVIGIIVIPAIWLSAASCASQARAMGLEYSYGPLQDCMVKVDGQVIPLDQYATVRLTRPNP